MQIVVKIYQNVSIIKSIKNRDIDGRTYETDCNYWQNFLARCYIFKGQTNVITVMVQEGVLLKSQLLLEQE